MATSVPYQAFHNDEDIGVNEDSISDSGSDHTQDYQQSYPAGPSSPPVATYFDDPRHRTNRAHIYTLTKWPYHMGCLLLVHGCVLLALGIAQVIVVPLVLDMESQTPVSLSKHSCYGVGIWCGFLIGLTGSIGLSAAIHECISKLYAFTLFVIFNIIVQSAFILIILIGYTYLWTVPSAYDDGGVGFGLHVAVSVMTCLAFIFNLYAFTQYYEEVLCGDIQLCRKIVHCCCPCWCPRAVYQEELMDEDAGNLPPTERPPSLPV